MEKLFEEFSPKTQKQWNDKRDSKIIFVYGNEWVAGNFSYHLKDRPIWVSDKFSKKIEGKILICGKSNKNEKTG